MTSRSAPGLTGAPVRSARPRRRRLLTVAVAFVVLRATQAAVAVLTLLLAAVLRLEQPLPHLQVARLSEIGLQPLTPLTALVMVAVCAVGAVVLLRRRQVVLAFAGVKVFALLVASTIGGVMAGGDGGLRLVLAGCGAGLAVLLWPVLRRAAVFVLVAVGLPHPAGRLADVVLMVKIALLVVLVVAGP
ncbi:histidine kinase [Frankia sp. AgKG'84/4]|uniref:histidine kinase n=1 Tax=Frankia sp. AgKG'84/4 TaxID=573490 RepID=UPI00200D150F|nr:histidine kinase [Frankia sp. AgKG'84/4]MCL9793464.1 histidine kinase [Frankia sp. AgKG'84/4]